jgi:hypothetical protein
MAFSKVSPAGGKLWRLKYRFEEKKPASAAKKQKNYR